MKQRNRTEFIDFIQIKSGDTRENAISLVDKLLKTLNCNLIFFFLSKFLLF